MRHLYQHLYFLLCIPLLCFHSLSVIGTSTGRLVLERNVYNIKFLPWWVNYRKNLVETAIKMHQEIQ